MKVVSRPVEAEAFWYPGPEKYQELIKWLGEQNRSAAYGSEDGSVFFPALHKSLSPKGYVVVQEGMLSVYNDTVDFWDRFTKVVEDGGEV